MEFRRKQIENPIISIITPYYNSGKYIKQTAKSVLTQTFKNFEWIIVDDGSNEQEFQKLKQIEKMDKRIRIFKTNGNIRACWSKRLWNNEFCKFFKIYCIFRC